MKGKHIYLLSISLFIIFLLTSQSNFLLTHSLIELFSVFIGISIGIIVLNVYSFTDNYYLIFLGIAYLFISTVDLFHTLAYQGINVFETGNPNLATQFWIMGRYLEAFTIILSFRYLKKKNFNINRVFISYFFLTVLLISLPLLGYFPDCFKVGSGLTNFKIISEYIIIIIILFGLYFIEKYSKYLNKKTKKYLKIAFTTTILAELAFTLYTDVYGLANLTGHLLKLLSFYAIYQATISSTLNKPVENLFQKINHSNQLLKKNEQFIKSILDSLPASIAVIDAKGEIITVNESWKEFSNKNEGKSTYLGWNYLDVCKKSCKNDPEQSCEFGNAIAEVINGDEKYFTAEYTCHSPEKKRWFMTQATPLAGPQEGAVISHIDITERKQIEEKNKQLSLAVEQSPTSVVITDLDGNIQYVNPKFTELTGYSMVEALGENPRILKSGLQSKEVYEDLWDSLTSGQEWRGEFCNQKKNGEFYWENASISPLTNDANEVTHYVAVKENITQRKEMEEELKKAKQIAESANAAKTKFLAQMSHEIRNPMNGIIGLSELLLESNVDANIKKHLQMIYSSTKILLDIINDILDLSKIEAGKLELIEEKFSINDMVEAALNPFTIRAHQKNNELTSSIEPAIPEYLIGDSSRIKQILINLLSNSIKFTEGGSINLKVELKNIEDENYYIDFSVTDTGQGMTKDEVKNIFESFNQASAGQKSKQGTGLGLAIVKELTELMQGEIKVNSEYGQGTTFNFMIPLKKAKEKINQIANPTTSNNNINTLEKEPVEKINAPQKINILLAEDNYVNQELVRSLLAKKNWPLTIVDNGAEAIEKLAQAQFDILLMDIQMPIMDGLTATKKIRKNEKDNHHLPIIAMTANAMQEDKNKCLASGMDSFISKPIQANKLFNEINRLTNIENKDQLHASFANKENPIKNTSNNSNPPVDIDTILDRIGGNQTIFKKMIAILLEKYPSQLNKLKNACYQGDPKLIKQQAHSFKGALSNYAAGKAYEIVKNLEKMGEEGYTTGAVELYSQLESEMDKIKDYFEEYELN